MAMETRLEAALPERRRANRKASDRERKERAVPELLSGIRAPIPMHALWMAIIGI